MEYNVDSIRKDFPMLKQEVYGRPLVYLDNGATTQKPLPVIECIRNFHSFKNSSIHRGIHFYSERATEEFENARKTVQQFIHAEKSSEIIFTSGTTSSVNGLAWSFGERFIRPGDEIIISEMEHHSNIVPWQMLCERKGSVLKVLPFNDDGILEIDRLDALINNRTRLISVMHISNTLGTINPIRTIIEKAHENDIPVLIDAAQSVQHIAIDVQQLDCDFLVFSGHKIYGPTGIGVLYAKEKWLHELPPFQGGGEMVDVVTFQKTTYTEPPVKFEAGTPNYIGAIGLAEALKYVTSTGLSGILQHENALLDYGFQQLSQLDFVKLYGQASDKSSILSFNLRDIHYYDAGMIIDKMGIAVRTGTHCAQPVMQHYGISGTIRASLGMYNTKEEIDNLVGAIKKVRDMFV
ncbi:MAG: cysteine desulfurase [Bacteroidales bacterium]|nr:cysteine desulfurase [Bacteroidales bacterium]